MDEQILAILMDIREELRQMRAMAQSSQSQARAKSAEADMLLSKAFSLIPGYQPPGDK